MSKSQFGQDVYLMTNIYPGKRDGFFVEVGAYDGIESSNTYMLEKQYNWKGLCVECVPHLYEKCKAARSCPVSSNAVYNEDGKVLEFYNSGGYGGLVETNRHAHIVNHPKIKVTTKRLTTLLDEINAPAFIEYLSLDTEGSEYEILKAHDFDKYRFGYIGVEHNHQADNRQNIRSLLESKGYRFRRENHVDDEYQYAPDVPA